MGFGKLAEVIVIVPARMGSSRLPGKPLADLCGEPLIIRVLDNLGTSPNTEVVVATDSHDIAAVVQKGGYRAVMTGDAFSGTHRVYLAWRAMGSPGGRIVNLQGDEPCASMDWVRELTSSTREGVSTLASPIDVHEAADPSTVKVVVGEEGRALYFSRSPVPWGDGCHLKHAGVYCFTPDSLEACMKAGETALSRRERLEQLAWLERGIPITVVSGNWDAMGVDTPADLERARRRFDGC
ncbi:MAG: manno-octulosonate cytidylyltransferase [Candidatus Fermentibacteraceae bacterium]